MEGDSRGKKCGNRLPGTDSSTLLWQTLFRNSRLVGIKGIFPLVKPIPTILPSHTNLQGEERKEDKSSGGLAPLPEAVLAF